MGGLTTNGGSNEIISALGNTSSMVAANANSILMIDD